MTFAIEKHFRRNPRQIKGVQVQRGVERKALRSRGAWSGKRCAAGVTPDCELAAVLLPMVTARPATGPTFPFGQFGVGAFGPVVLGLVLLG